MRERENKRHWDAMGADLFYVDCLYTTDVIFQKLKDMKYLNPIKIFKISIDLLESKVRNNTIEWNNCIG